MMYLILIGKFVEIKFVNGLVIIYKLLTLLISEQPWDMLSRSLS